MAGQQKLNMNLGYTVWQKLKLSQNFKKLKNLLIMMLIFMQKSN